MNGIKNFLEYINNNWTAILVIIGLLISLGYNVKNYLSKSDVEKIEIAKKQLSERMLKLITDAEINFEDWNKSGSIKRSQVIGEIYNEYLVLSKVTDQQAIIDWIDTEINNSLKTLRKVVKENLVVDESNENIATKN